MTATTTHSDLPLARGDGRLRPRLGGIHRLLGIETAPNWSELPGSLATSL